VVGVKASPYGVRVANVGQEQGGKGDAQKEGHTVRHEADVVTSLSRWLRLMSEGMFEAFLRHSRWSQDRQAEPANPG
jgi:hypothetical protein